MLSRVCLAVLLSVLLSDVLMARNLRLATQAVRLFNTAIIVGGLSLAGVAQADEWQDVSANSAGHRQSVFHLRTLYRGVDYVLHLVYIGTSKDRENIFVGILPQVLRADKPLGREVRRGAEYSLYSHEGLVGEDLELAGEEFYPVTDSGKIVAVDVVVGIFEGLDMADYQPISLDVFPEVDEGLELLNYYPDKEPRVLRWQSCLAGRSRRATQLAEHTCRLPWRPQAQIISSLGAPLFNDKGRLVGFTTMQSDNRQQNMWPTDKSIVFDRQMLRYIPVAMDVSPTVTSTTWAELKQDRER